MAPSENSAVLSLTDTVDSSKSTAKSTVDIMAKSTYEVAVTVMEIDKTNPKSWSTGKKLLVVLGPILTGFIGYVLNPEFWNESILIFQPGASQFLSTSPASQGSSTNGT